MGLVREDLHSITAVAAPQIYTNRRNRALKLAYELSSTKSANLEKTVEHNSPTSNKGYREQRTDWMDKAEGRIDETDDKLLATSKRVKRLTLHQASLEARLIDHDARMRRKSLRIYRTSNGNEGTDVTGLKLKATLESP